MRIGAWCYDDAGGDRERLFQTLDGMIDRGFEQRAVLEAEVRIEMQKFCLFESGAIPETRVDDVGAELMKESDIGPKESKHAGRDAAVAAAPKKTHLGVEVLTGLAVAGPGTTLEAGVRLPSRSR